jgi:hypothetical protein
MGDGVRGGKEGGGRGEEGRGGREGREGEQPAGRGCGGGKVEANSGSASSSATSGGGVDAFRRAPASHPPQIHSIQ